MRRVVELLRSRSWPRLALLALVAVGVAGCSAESSRFGDDNPFASQQRVAADVDRLGPQPAGARRPGARASRCRR